MPAISINIRAVLVSGLAGFIIGGIWYGPLFGEQWLAAHGAQGRAIPAIAFVVGALSYVAVAAVMGFILSRMQVTSIGTGMLLGFALWAAISFLLGLNVALFSGRPLITFWIDAGCQLLVFVSIGAIVASWR